TWDEENPALGWRAIRIGLDRPALLRSQLRALVRAAAGRDLSIMFPMIAQVSEFVEAKAILKKELEKAERRPNGPPKSVRVGAMIEVPAIVWQLPHLLTEADFISVGSNDLMQFFLDRKSTRLNSSHVKISYAV